MKSVLRVFLPTDQTAHDDVFRSRIFQPPRPPRARKPKPVPPVQLGPTTIWAGDPRQRGALMLVRLPAGPLANVLQLVEQYSQRYDDVALSAAQSAGPTASQAPVLARWIRGVRVEE